MSKRFIEAIEDDWRGEHRVLVAIDQISRVQETPDPPEAPCTLLYLKPAPLQTPPRAEPCVFVRRSYEDVKAELLGE